MSAKEHPTAPQVIDLGKALRDSLRQHTENPTAPTNAVAPAASETEDTHPSGSNVSGAAAADIETLSVWEHMQLADGLLGAGRKALAIIDALTARVKELEAEAKDHETDVDQWEARESELNARVAELEGQYETSHRSRLHAEECLRAANARAEAAERDLEACKTELRQVDKSPPGQTTAPMVHFMNEAARWKAKCEAAEADTHCRYLLQQKAESEAAEWKAKCEAAERKLAELQEVANDQYEMLRGHYDPEFIARELERRHGDE